MPRKPRDHKAEWARRKQLAAQRGTTVYRQRKALETGKRAPLRPNAIRSERTRNAVKNFLRSVTGTRRHTPVQVPSSKERRETEAWLTKAGFTPYKRARDFSRDRAQTPVAKLDIGSGRMAEAKRKYIAKHGRKAYNQAYIDAWISGDGIYTYSRYRGGSHELYVWLVEVTEYYTAEEFELKYGGTTGE